MANHPGAAFDGKVPLAFIAATIGLSWFADGLATPLIDVVGAPGQIAGGLALLLAGVTLAWPWYRSLTRRKWPSLTGMPAAPAVVLVLTATPGGPRSVVAAVMHHLPTVRRVYLLYTEDAPGCQALAEARTAIEAGGLNLSVIRACGVAEAAAGDPMPVYLAVQRCLAEAIDEGYALEDVVLDYTGGTKAFTAAFALVGAHAGRRLQYVVPEWRDADGRPAVDAPLKVIEVDLRFEVRSVEAR